MYTTAWKKTLSRLKTLEVQDIQDSRAVCATLRMYQALYEMDCVSVAANAIADRSFCLSRIEALYHTLYVAVRQTPSWVGYSHLLACYDAFSAYSVRIAREEIWEQAVLDVETQVSQPNWHSRSDYYLVLQLIHRLWSGVEWPADESLPPSLAYLRAQCALWDTPDAAEKSVSVYETLLRQALRWEIHPSSVQPESETMYSFRQLFQSVLSRLQRRQEQTLTVEDTACAVQLVELLHRYPILSDPKAVSHLITWLPQQPSFPFESQQMFAALAFEDQCFQQLREEQQTFWETAAAPSFLSLSR